MLPNLNRGTDRLVIRFGRHVERIALYFINFASPLAECPCSTSRASSNRWMLPNLNRGTDHLVIRFDGHVERIAFCFIAAWRMSRTF
jgi:hypothetical protein